MKIECCVLSGENLYNSVRAYTTPKEIVEDMEGSFVVMNKPSEQRFNLISIIEYIAIKLIAREDVYVPISADALSKDLLDGIQKSESDKILWDNTKQVKIVSMDPKVRHVTEALLKAFKAHDQEKFPMEKMKVIYIEALNSFKPDQVNMIDLEALMESFKVNYSVPDGIGERFDTVDDLMDSSEPSHFEEGNAIVYDTTPPESRHQQVDIDLKPPITTPVPMTNIVPMAPVEPASTTVPATNVGPVAPVEPASTTVPAINVGPVAPVVPASTTVPATPVVIQPVESDEGPLCTTDCKKLPLYLAIVAFVLGFVTVLKNLVGLGSSTSEPEKNPIGSNNGRMVIHG